MMYFFHSGRKLLFASAVYNMYLSTQTKCGSCSIHSHVTAAYHSYLLTMHDRCSGIGVKRLHQIASGQVFIGREYTVGILAGDTHELRKSCTGTDKYSLEALFVHQLIDGHGFTYHYVGFNMNTERFYIFDLFCHNAALGKTELRDTVYQYTACLMQCLEDGNIITHLCQISGTSQTCGTGTNNSYLFTVLLCCRCGFDTVFPCPVSYKTLQLTDRDGIPLEATDTFSFTLAFLGAYTTADSGKCAGFTDDTICFFDIATLHLFNELRDLDRYGTALYTLCIFTVNAAGSLFHCFFFVISETHLFEVGSTFLCILLSDRNSF